LLSVDSRMRFEDRRKNPRVVRSDHWGAAKVRAPTWRDRTSLYLACPPRGGSASRQVDQIHLYLFTAIRVPVQQRIATSVVNAYRTGRSDPIFYLMTSRTGSRNVGNRSILIVYRAVGSERVPAGTTRSIMNSECVFDHSSASRFISKNRSTTMALSWLAVRPHSRAALRLTTAVSC
jgi:hypothetical protein